MKIKVFQIRLTNENLQSDQDKLSDFMESVVVKKSATQLIVGQPNYWSIIVFYDDHKLASQEKKLSPVTENSEARLDENEKRILEVLKQWRLDKATSLNIPSFMVCHNAELIAIAKIKPKTIEDLSIIKGFGPQKLAKFGDLIIAALNSI